MIELHTFQITSTDPIYLNSLSPFVIRTIVFQVISADLLGGRHKEGRSRGTGHDPTSLKHQNGEGQITVDVVLNIGI